MTASWGLTGPQFLGVYFVTYLLALALMYGFRAVLTHTESDPENPRPLLDPYETAYLAGGPGRTVSAAIANLALSDRLLVSRSGALTVPADVEPLDDVDAAVGLAGNGDRRFDFQAETATRQADAAGRIDLAVELAHELGEQRVGLHVLAEELPRPGHLCRTSGRTYKCHERRAPDRQGLRRR